MSRRDRCGNEPWPCYRPDCANDECVRHNAVKAPVRSEAEDDLRSEVYNALLDQFQDPMLPDHDMHSQADYVTQRLMSVRRQIGWWHDNSFWRYDDQDVIPPHAVPAWVESPKETP